MPKVPSMKDNQHQNQNAPKEIILRNLKNIYKSRHKSGTSSFIPGKNLHKGAADVAQQMYRTSCNLKTRETFKGYT